MEFLQYAVIFAIAYLALGMLTASAVRHLTNDVDDARYRIIVLSWWWMLPSVVLSAIRKWRDD